MVEPNSRPTNAIQIGSRLELFVDDALIDRLSAAERRLHHPVPQEVAMVFDRPWEGNWSAGMSVLRADDGIFRLYYKAGRYGTPEYLDSAVDWVDTRKTFGCYIESSDGITWARPSVGVIEVAGTRENNVVLTEETGGSWPGETSHPSRIPEQGYRRRSDTRASPA